MAAKELNRVVKRGTFLYDGQVQCDMRIIESNVLYGYFEGEWIEPAVAEHENGPRYYYIEFGSPVEVDAPDAPAAEEAEAGEIPAQEEAAPVEEPEAEKAVGLAHALWSGRIS